MKFNKILSYSALAIFTMGILASCEDDSVTSNQTDKEFVSFADKPTPVDVPEGETVTVEAQVYAGHESNQDRVLGLQVITASTSGQTVTTAATDEYVVPATVTIPAGSKVGTFQVTLTDIDLGYTGQTVVIGIVPQAGIDQAMYTAAVSVANGGGVEIINDRLVITARRQCLANTFSIQISTDNYGSETTWELYDGDFNLLASGGPYADSVVGGGETFFTCLEDGNYTFVAYDQYGDGMYDGTNQGFYRLVKYDADGNEIEIAKNGTFGDYDTVEFSLP